MLWGCAPQSTTETIKLSEAQTIKLKTLSNFLLTADNPNANLLAFAKSIETVLAESKLDHPSESAHANIMQVNHFQNSGMTGIRAELIELQAIFNFCLIGAETALSNKQSELNNRLENLAQLMDQNTRNSLNEIVFYYADNDTRLLAFSIESSDARYYVGFNYSWEIHEMPLPFGFMASTKVTTWESDIGRLNTFVTQQPIVIRPFTAMIIAV